MQHNRLFWIGITTLILLLIPAIAMQYTNEVNWKFFDFVMAFVLLYTAGFLCDLVLRKIPKLQHRIILLALILLGLLIVWAELAVGILSDFNLGY